MNKTVLIGMTAVALSLGACAKRTPPPAAEVPPAATTNPNSTDPNSLEVVELPALQADLVAKAGSDTVYFGTDEYSLDEASKATLAALSLSLTCRSTTWMDSWGETYSQSSHAVQARTLSPSVS